MNSYTIPLSYPDEHTNILNVVEPESEQIDRSYLILPALGVRASFYQALSRGIAERGFRALNVDWRGNGTSSIRPRRGIDFGYADLIADIKLAVDTILNRYANTELILIGHSLGGQLGSLFVSRYPELVGKLTIVAACSVYYRGWPMLPRLGIRLMGNGCYRLANLLGYFPGDRLGFGGREFPRVMHDWGNNALSGQYRLLYDDFDYEAALQSAAVQVRAFNIAGDNYAPPSAMHNLLEKFGPAATVNYQQITPELAGATLNHFSWAKKSGKIVDLLVDW